MIVITGATGHFGSQVVERLLERVSPDQIAVSVREPDRVQALAARGVRVRHGDFTDPGTLAAAFEDASQVLVVSVDELGEKGVAQNTAAIDAAYGAGARRVLYTSHQAASPGSLFPPARDHAVVEAHLERGGRPYTSLRNGYYTSSLQFLIGDAAHTGELVAPADGPVSWTTREDLAEAAAVILADEGRFDGPTPPLTADQAIDLEAVGAILSKVSGRTVRRLVVDDNAFAARLTEHGTPEPFAQLMLGTYRAARRGEFAVTDPTLKTLLGRAPQQAHPTLESSVTE